jgi:hypothetical protein
LFSGEDALGVKNPPKRMPGATADTHAHHIVMKGHDDYVKVINGTPVKVVEESKKILEKYDIDWLYGQENLAWAPKTGHSIEYAADVWKALDEADRIHGTREEIVKALQQSAEKFIKKHTR